MKGKPSERRYDEAAIVGLLLSSQTDSSSKSSSRAVQLRVEAGQGIDHRREHGHGRSINRKAIEMVLVGFVKQGARGQPFLEIVQFAA